MTAFIIALDMLIHVCMDYKLIFDLMYVFTIIWIAYLLNPSCITKVCQSVHHSWKGMEMGQNAFQMM
jgi:hypothetical protein